MLSVWKFPLGVAVDSGILLKWDSEQYIEMPVGAKILSGNMQFGVACLWALVDPQARREMRRFYVVNTGGSLPDDFKEKEFITTLILAEGTFVLHVFEDRKS